jgi:hypothetical protein
VAGGLKEELSVTAGEADAFSQLVENARRPRPKPDLTLSAAMSASSAATVTLSCLPATLIPTVNSSTMFRPPISWT